MFVDIQPVFVCVLSAEDDHRGFRLNNVVRWSILPENLNSKLVVMMAVFVESSKIWRTYVEGES